jgi:diaminohydroxyphosphoribosylaminopyrimidine deaminase / 5-amino-6-(5-phosphoribosylamino)uracil reductase
MTSGDSKFLRRALALAEGGRGRVSPNPLVGAVVVRDGEIIGEGFHAELGGLHAERAALADASARGEDVTGATMYVTLEPCAHQGRQPPCADAVIEARIGRVVIASDDPTEKAAGKGPERIRDAGIEVEFIEGSDRSRDGATGEAVEISLAARLLNQPFRKFGRNGWPWVMRKTAMSLDGRTATPPGTSPWISGEASRDLVHAWRGEFDAIAVGIGTVLADDPLLTARRGGAPAVGPGTVADSRVGAASAEPGAVAAASLGEDPPALRQPTRVVFDSDARLPLDSRLMQTLDQSPVIVVTGPDPDSPRVEALRAAGAETFAVGEFSGGGPEARVGAALIGLGRRGITSLMLEGGATLANSFARAEQIDEARVFVAPKLLGGPIPDLPIAVLRGAPGDPERIGEDTLIRTRFKEW